MDWHGLLEFVACASYDYPSFHEFTKVTLTLCSLSLQSTNKNKYVCLKVITWKNRVILDVLYLYAAYRTVGRGQSGKLLAMRTIALKYHSCNLTTKLNLQLENKPYIFTRNNGPCIKTLGMIQSDVDSKTSLLLF